MAHADDERTVVDHPLVLVSGATRGIGRAIAERLAADGALVAVNGRKPSAALDEVVAATGGLPAPADISDRAGVLTMIAAIEQTAGRPVDALVANAAYMSMAPFLAHDPQDWWRVIDTNLSGTFHLVQAVLPGMRRMGNGRIVIISSYWGVIGWPNATAYAASKAGLIALAKTLGRELAPDNIVVNAVAPGIVDTDQLEVDSTDAGVPLAQIRSRYARNIPLGRIGRPEEIGAIVAMLLAPRAAPFVGQILHVNGGELRARA
jgi:NAD(P)-dependent dehydrogenase (short-subunit alcohol dehydrogenase family)